MLDQFPATEALDHLVWEAVKVVERYADPATTPGPEHLGLAALIMEGVASDCASANWDDLIEKAVRIVDGPNSAVLQVRVISTDVQDDLRRARLYKFPQHPWLAAHLTGRPCGPDPWAERHREDQPSVGDRIRLTGAVASLGRFDPNYVQYLPHKLSASDACRIQIEGTGLEAATAEVRGDGSRLWGEPLLENDLSRFFTERCYLPQAALGRLLEIYEHQDSRRTDSPDSVCERAARSRSARRPDRWASCRW